MRSLSSGCTLLDLGSRCGNRRAAGSAVVGCLWPSPGVTASSQQACLQEG